MFMLQTAITEHLSGLSQLSSAETRKEAKMKKTRDDMILQGLNDAMQELAIARQNFDFVTDPLLVDMYAYQIKAADTKYRYLLGIARQNGLVRLDYCERIGNQMKF